MSEPLIMVPLDCSELSERAVPYASAMAKATGAHLLVLTVWEEGERAIITNLHDLAEDLFKRLEEHYAGYLAGVAKQLEAEASRSRRMSFWAIPRRRSCALSSSAPRACWSWPPTVAPASADGATAASPTRWRVRRPYRR